MRTGKAVTDAVAAPQRTALALTAPGPVTRARNTALALALAGLVVAAVVVNAGFWAAVVQADTVARMLSLPVIAMGLFTAAAFLVGIILHWIKVALQRL